MRHVYPPRHACPPARRVSPDRRLILISGEHVAGLPGGWADDRVVVVHLTPKAVRPTGGHSTHATPTPPRVDPNKTLRARSRAVVD